MMAIITTYSEEEAMGILIFEDLMVQKSIMVVLIVNTLKD